MKQEIWIENKKIGVNCPTFIIAEISGNHLQDYNRAVELINIAKEVGADAVKLQTYTAHTLTLNCRTDYFQASKGSIWEGMNLYDLYNQAYTPWEWQPKLKQLADELGIICFSSPFDFTAVDFMERMNMPAYKIASFEITDIPLIRKVAKRKKPVILSTGIAKLEDIERAVQVCKEEKNEEVILLKCTSTYPTPFEDIHLKTMENMRDTFECITGLSDHTMGNAVAIASVALGAKVVEKHLTIKRADGGPDGAFSMEPDEWKEMVQNIRNVEKAIGTTTYQLTEKQLKSRKNRRSLFVASDIKKGELFTEENIRSVRPGYGLHTKYYEEILGKRAKQDLTMGTPLAWDLIDN